MILANNWSPVFQSNSMNSMQVQISSIIPSLSPVLPENNFATTFYILSHSVESNEYSQLSNNDNPSEVIEQTNILHPSSDKSVYNSVQGDDNTVSLADVLIPLNKYFVDNKCLLCGFTSSAKDHYRAKQHLATHLTTRNFKCDICNKTFKTPEAVSSHKQWHKGQQKYFCKICDKFFLSKGSLKVHERTHSSTISEACTICKKVFRSPKHLKQHHTIHTGEKPYSCSICHSKFRTLCNLKVHLYKHNPKSEWLSCDVCDKKFSSQKRLDNHKKLHSEPQYICKICDKVFHFYSNLIQHKLVHSDLRRHSCETCGMKFKLPHHLKSHIATHHV